MSNEEKQEKEQETEGTGEEFQNRVEGRDAVSKLYEAWESEGLTIDPNLEKRVVALEQEVSTLKDLLSRALNVNKSELLKD